MSNPEGRPSEYSIEVIQKTKDYLLSCTDEEREVVNGDKTTTRLKVNLPSIEGLAVYLGVARKTIYNWADVYPEFLHILELLLSEQAKRLVGNGLSGDYNSTIAKLILTKHGYTDKQEFSGRVEASGLSDEEKAKLLSLLNDKTAGSSEGN